MMVVKMLLEPNLDRGLPACEDILLPRTMEIEMEPGVVQGLCRGCRGLKNGKCHLETGICTVICGDQGFPQPRTMRYIALSMCTMFFSAASV